MAGCQEFNGSSQYITVPDHADFDWAADASFTIALWFNTNSTSGNQVMIGRDEQGSCCTHWWLGLLNNSGYANWNLLDEGHNGVGVSGGTNLADGDWHFLAGTYDGENMTCFVDGQIESVECDSIRTSEGSVVIGTWGSNFFTGVLDEARICNAALTEEQLRADYEGGYSFLAVDSTSKLSTTWAKIKAQ